MSSTWVQIAASKRGQTSAPAKALAACDHTTLDAQMVNAAVSGAVMIGSDEPTQHASRA